MVVLLIILLLMGTWVFYNLFCWQRGSKQVPSSCWSLRSAPSLIRAAVRRVGCWGLSRCLELPFSPLLALLSWDQVHARLRADLPTGLNPAVAPGGGWAVAELGHSWPCWERGIWLLREGVHHALCTSLEGFTPCPAVGGGFLIPVWKEAKQQD